VTNAANHYATPPTTTPCRMVKRPTNEWVLLADLHVELWSHLSLLGIYLADQFTCIICTPDSERGNYGENCAYYIRIFTVNTAATCTHVIELSVNKHSVSDNRHTVWQIWRHSGYLQFHRLIIIIPTGWLVRAGRGFFPDCFITVSMSVFMHSISEPLSSFK